MDKHYKCVKCCTKCTQKGFFVPTQNELEDWDCPFDSPGCESQIVPVPWYQLHKKRLMLASAGFALLFALVYILTGGGEVRRLNGEFKELTAKVDSWSAAVNKLPQNPGLSDPYAMLWVDKIELRTSRLQSVPADGIREDLNKLEEELRRLDEEKSKAEALDVPVVGKTPENTQYRDLRKEGSAHRADILKLSSRAKLAKAAKQLKSVNVLESELKEGLAKIHRKSRPSGDAKNLDCAKTKAAYVSAIDGAIAKVKLAIDNIPEPPPPPPPPPPPTIDDIWNKAEPILTIQISNDLESHLAYRLVEGYLKPSGRQITKTISEPEGKDVRRYIISGTGGAKSIQMGSKLNESDSKTIVIDYQRKMDSGQHTEVIAIDAMVVMVGSKRQLASLSLANLEKIAAGKTRTWSDLNAGNGQLNLIVPSENTAQWQVMPQELQLLLEQNARAQKSVNIGDLIKGDESAIAFGAYHKSRGAKRIPISPSDGLPGVFPEPSSISSEDYRYTSRLYCHTIEEPVNEVAKFKKFILSESGQKLISQAGFINLLPGIIPYPEPPEYVAKAYIGEEILEAYKMNFNFRFDTDSSKLDIKAQADLARLNENFELYVAGDRSCLLAGFTDSDGSRDYNDKLSTDRANHVFEQINQSSGSGIIKVGGFGLDYPVADNDTDHGKAQNRRVEVWIVKTR